jgi:hypothetical protein
MKKGLLGIAAGVVALVIGVGTVMAGGEPVPSVTIGSIGGVTPIGGALTLNVNAFPTTVDIVGTASIDHATLDGAKLTLSENGNAFYGPDVHYWAGIGDVQTAPFTVPWTINAGDSQRTIMATIKHGNEDGTDTVLVTLSINVTVNQCKAAPAIANELLKLILKKPKAANVSNFVSQVAHQMGPQTDFNGVHACDKVAYRSAINTFLIRLGAY